MTDDPRDPSALGPEDPQDGCLVCTSCGQVQRFANPALAATEALIARAHGFQLSWSSVELYGACVRCQVSREGPPSPPRRS